jgi:hypothetical protein
LFVSGQANYAKSNQFGPGMRPCIWLPKSNNHNGKYGESDSMISRSLDLSQGLENTIHVGQEKERLFFNGKICQSSLKLGGM